MSPATSSGTPATAAGSPSDATPASTSTSTTDAPAPVTGKPTSMTLSAVGDIIPHAIINQTAARGSGYDFTPMFADVKPIISASTLSICQLETPLTTTNADLSHRVTFNAPHQLGAALRDTGFDGCSTANNHTWDQGLSGVRSTRKVLADNAIQDAGPTASAAGSGAPATYNTPVKVAQLSYAYSVTNAIEVETTTPPTGAPWLRDNLYLAQGTSGIISSALRAKAAGAEVVVVSMHWGSQYHSVSNDQRAMAKTLLSSGAVDLILGAHPHIVQPCAKINGRYVLYSLGNFLSDQGVSVGTPASTQDGVLPTVTFTRDTTGQITQSMVYRPTWVDHAAGHRVVLTSPTSHADSYRRTVATMSSLGAQCDARVAGTDRSR